MTKMKPVSSDFARPLRARNLCLGAAPREMGVVAALTWAFATEKAQLEFDDMARDGARPGVSGIYVMMQRGALGCQIDGGGHSRPAHDAEVIANMLAGMPERLGGRAMAAHIAALARADATPDWKPNPQPRCVPQGWRGTRHGNFATTRKIGTVTLRSRGRDVTHEIFECPVTYVDSADEVAQIRAGYHAWWDAVNWLRAALIGHNACDRLRITEDMPPRDPWRAIYHKRSVP